MSSGSSISDPGSLTIGRELVNIGWSMSSSTISISGAKYFFFIILLFILLVAFGEKSFKILFKIVQNHFG